MSAALSRHTQDRSSGARNTTSERAKQSRSLVRAGIGALISVGMLVFLLWIPVIKTGRFEFGSDGWIVFALMFGAIGVSAYCFYRAVRLRMPPKDNGCCRRCGYDLRGNTSGVCPECGAASDRAEPAA